MHVSTLFSLYRGENIKYHSIHFLFRNGLAIFSTATLDMSKETYNYKCIYMLVYGLRSDGDVPNAMDKETKQSDTNITVLIRN